ncbi:MAG: PadR family transcriptional regulator [Bacillota bacterium]
MPPFGGPRGAFLFLPWILLRLAEGPSHGYHLLERYGGRPGFAGPPLLPGTLYRWLRALERRGLVSSSWQAGEFGPARRSYTLTAAGWQVLDEAAAQLRQRRREIDAFLDAYERLRGMGPPGTSSRSPLSPETEEGG